MSIVLISDGALERAGCGRLAETLQQRNRPCLTVGPALPSLQPLAGMETEVMVDPLQLLGHPLLEQASAIGLFLQRPQDVHGFVRAYRAICRYSGRPAAPVFSGPLIPLVGDALVQDLIERCCCDLLLVSGDVQLKQVQAMTFNWAQHHPWPDTIATGFWFESKASGPPSPQRMLLALIQEGVPSYPGATDQLLRQLRNWARKTPSWTVVLQRDHAWRTDRPLIHDQNHWPSNLVSAAPGQMLPLLGRCTACLTVSSPWICAAMTWGSIPMIVADYGIHGRQGTTGFFGSGTMHHLRSVRQLDDLLNLPGVNQTWLDAMGGAISNGTERLLNALDKLSKPENRGSGAS